MLIKISETTFKLIVEDAISALKLTTPLSSESLDSIFTYFEEKEIFLSQNITDGNKVDSEYLKVVCTAVNELIDGDSVDLTDLNNRMEAYFKEQ